MNKALLLLASLLLVSGCISQPIRPAAPSVPNQYAQDIGPSASAVDQMQSKSYWNAAAPFAITAWKYSGNSLMLSMRNMDGQEITVNQVYAEGSLVFSSDTTFSPSDSRTITANTPAPCGTAGSGFEVSDIRIAYTKGSASGLEQKGAKPIVGTCS